MQIIRRPYKFFGYQCKECGCYFLYNEEDLLISGSVCPHCQKEFEHDINNVDIEPTKEYISTLKSFSKDPAVPIFMAMGSLIYRPGDEVYVVYDKYYAKGGSTHEWVLSDKKHKVHSVNISIEEGKDEEVEYRFADIIFYANDPRQHCSETFDNGCRCFGAREDAVSFIKERNKC